MKKIYLILFFTLLLTSSKLWGQEEFFHQRSGLTFAYMNGIKTDYTGGGLSFFHESGINFSFSTVNLPGNRASQVSFGKFSREKEAISHEKYYFGVSYLISQTNAVSLNNAFSYCFNPGRNFPTAITGNFNFNLYFTKNNSFYSGSSSNQTAVSWGIDVKQAFWAKGQMFPFISVGYGSDSFTNESVYGLMTGLIIAVSK
ncbi:hypothetical protein E9993_21355 [Labilibacter sediminis]|nr:hypothetical protein E9993_21355 [Labilibacter sediminis]